MSTTEPTITKVTLVLIFTEFVNLFISRIIIYHEPHWSWCGSNYCSHFLAHYLKINLMVWKNLLIILAEDLCSFNLISHVFCKHKPECCFRLFLLPWIFTPMLRLHFSFLGCPIFYLQWKFWNYLCKSILKHCLWRFYMEILSLEVLQILQDVGTWNTMS